MNLTSLKTLLLDGDGVLWHGSAPVPGIVHFFDALRRREIEWALITNNATRGVNDLVARLEGFGVAAHPRNIFTSAVATASYLREHVPSGQAIYIVGEVGLQEAIHQAGYIVDTGLDDTTAPAAVVAGLDRQFSYAKLKKAMRLIRAGATFIATNPDPTFPGSEGLSPGAWSIISAIITASDTQPVVIGKPGAPLFEVAIKTLSAQVETTAMLGDRLETDILGAQRAGLASILVLSGVSSRDDIARSGIHPDLIFDDITALADELDKYPVTSQSSGDE